MGARAPRGMVRRDAEIVARRRLRRSAEQRRCDAADRAAATGRRHGGWPTIRRRPAAPPTAPLPAAPLPPDEAERLRALADLGVLDTPAEPEFDGLVQAAALVCGTSISLLSLVDRERQWFKAASGLPEPRETPRALSFCAHAILDDATLVVPDLQADPRFADNPLVTGHPDLRFYAGVPLRLAGGPRVGTLCVLDPQPRQLDAGQREVLAHLAAAAVRLLEGRRALAHERAARSSVARAAAVLAHSADAVVGLSLEARVTLWNPAAERLTGYAAAQMLGQPLARLSPPGQGLDASRLHDLLRDHPEGTRYRVNALDARGQAQLVSVSLAPIPGPDGRPEGAAMIVRDVGEQARAAAALAASEARFRAFAEASPVGIFATDAQGRCTYTNARWQAIYGLGAEQALGEGWLVALHPDDRARVQAVMQRIQGRSPELDLAYRIVRPDGSVRHVRARAALVRDPRGQAQGHVGSVDDITEHLQAQQALAAAHERMALATDSGGIGVWDYEPASDTLRWDDWMVRLYGRVGLPLADGAARWAGCVHPEDRAAAEQCLERALADPAQTAYSDEFRVCHPDGSVHHLRASARIRRDADGRPVRLVGVNWDVTALRRLGAELDEQHELLRTTLQSIGDAVITTDAAGRVDWLNPVAERMSGWTSAEAHGRPLGEVFRTVDEDSRQPLPAPTERGDAPAPRPRALLVSRHGGEHGIEDSAAPIRNARGEVLGTVLVFRDVTEQRRLSGEMTWRATHDTLTGLVNRAEFESRLRQLLAQAQQDQGEHALMVIDLDQFKLVNDACGHAVGDRLLQQVAGLLQHQVRTRDTVARLGGDEFAVVLERCALPHAQRVAQQICDRMEDFRFVHEDRRFRVGASIGLVPLDARWASTAPLLQAADAACFAAKEAGRNRVHAWLDSDQAVRSRHGEMQWATRLEQALDEDRFALHAQRIVPLRDDDPDRDGLHAEVLLRLVEPDGTVVPPGAFLPAAERFHFASRIDRWVLHRTITTLRALPDLSGIALLGVNLSGRSIGDRAFHRVAMELLTEAGPAVCRRLCLEITETTAITSLADAERFIEQARGLGVRIALDDFGAGASSFGYLKKLSIDLLKIDGQFVRDLITDPLDDAAVRSFVEVARVLGVQTVAEFVEQPAVLERLRAIGIDHAQGYLLHRPEPLAAVLAGAGRPADGTR